MNFAAGMQRWPGICRLRISRVEGFALMTGLASVLSGFLATGAADNNDGNERAPLKSSLVQPGLASGP